MKKEGAESLPLKLTWVGEYHRKLDGVVPTASAYDPDEWMASMNDSDRQLEEIRPDNASYAFVKLTVPFPESPVTTQGRASWCMVRDPYLGLPFPRMKTHPNPETLQWVNEQLRQSHWGHILNALYCKASVAYDLGAWCGGDCGYKDEVVIVEYCSETLFSYIIAGSLYFGGPHPINHWSPVTLDLLERASLDFSKIFRLKQPDGEYTPQFMKLFERIQPKEETGCTVLPEHVSFHFDEKGLVVGNSDMPHVMAVCQGEMGTIPYRQLGPYFRPGMAKRYFLDPTTGGGSGPYPRGETPGY